MKKRKFNAADALIIAVVLLCIAGIAVRFTVLKDGVIGIAEKTAVVSFTASSVLPEAADAVRPGDELYFENGVKLGMLLEGYFISDAPTAETNAEGGIEISSDATVREIKGSVMISSVITSDGVLCGGRLLHKGDTVRIHSEQYAFTLKITDITEQ